MSTAPLTAASRRRGCGSTGEFSALSSEERLLLVETVVEQAKGRVPVIAQTGATSTAEAIRLSQAAEKAGADVLMLVTPYYEPLSLEETVTYIKDVARSVDIPVMLYNLPAATGVDLDPAHRPRAGRGGGEHPLHQEHEREMGQSPQLIHHHGDVIGTFIGWDVYLYSALAEGAAGVMAGTANVVPDEIVAVSRLIADGDLDGCP